MADIEVQPDGVRVAARAGEIVPAALFRSGYGYRVGCRHGGTCLTCRAVPRGDLVVRLRDERLMVVLPFLHADTFVSALT